MAFSAVVWAYKDLVTSAKLAQMVENTRTHDHRADGSQGADLVGAWTTFTATAASGWSLSGLKYRKILGGVGYLVEVSATRTNATALTFNSSGNVADETVATGLPAALTPNRSVYMVGNIPGIGEFTWRIDTSGTISITDGYPNASITNGTLVVMTGFLWFST